MERWGQSAWLAPMTGTLWRVLVVGMAVFPVLGGCVSPSASAAGESVDPVPNPHNPDIPLPAGFLLVDQSSEDWSNGPIRYVRHRYHGRADKTAVRRFYRAQMPLVRWTLVSDGSVAGRARMRFERAGESCTVAIEDGGTSLRRKVVVEVVIAPLTR